MEEIITVLFCFVDDFCKLYESLQKEKGESFKEIEMEIEKSVRRPSSRGNNKRIKRRNRQSRMHISEIMTIVIWFHFANCTSFKAFYIEQIMVSWKHFFPGLLSYTRFIQLMKKIFVPLMFLIENIKGTKTDLYRIDSTFLPVCHNLRISRHKTFKDLAKRGKSSMGWFYGFKLHLVINHLNQIMSFAITPGNCDDRKPVGNLTKGLKGLLIGDRGYISQTLFQKLYAKGLKLLTRLKASMKNKFLSMKEKLFLQTRKRIETSIHQLKNKYVLWHTRHRSPLNAFTHIFSSLIAYNINGGKALLSKKAKPKAAIA
jgi:hypothetical protein